MRRVLTARFLHETNTFSRVKTNMALIRCRDFHLDNEIPPAFCGTRSALGAGLQRLHGKKVNGAHECFQGGVGWFGRRRFFFASVN